MTTAWNVIVYRLPGSLSLNAAIFAAVILASRLPTSDHVFAFMALAVSWFGLHPHLRVHLAQSARFKIIGWLLDALTILASLFLSWWFVSAKFLGAVVVGFAFVAVGCPAWIILFLQPHKQVINGPWDEALPDCRLPPSEELLQVPSRHLLT